MKTFLTRTPYLAEYTSIMEKTRFEMGVVRGYASLLFGLQRDLQDGGIAAVSAKNEMFKTQLGLKPMAAGKRQITRAWPLRELFGFEKLEIDGKIVSFNEEFSGNGDWINGLVVTIKNLSDKRIVSLGLNINFPETSATGNMVRQTASYGRRPGMPAEVKAAERPVVEPGGSFQIRLDGNELKVQRSYFSSRQPIGELTRAELAIGIVYFDDGTAWSMGSYMKQDPNDPNRWVPIEITKIP